MNFSRPISDGFAGNGSDFRRMNKKRKRVGRGSGSGMGKTSTRGSNGQKARSGCALGNFEGGQKSITTLPMRGFKSTKTLAEKFNIVHLGDIVYKVQEGFIKSGVEINKNILLEAGLVKNLNKKVKVLFDGEISMALNIKADGYSKSVIDAVKKAGGSCL